MTQRWLGELLVADYYGSGGDLLLLLTLGCHAGWGLWLELVLVGWSDLGCTDVFIMSCGGGGVQVQIEVQVQQGGTWVGITLKLLFLTVLRWSISIIVIAWNVFLTRSTPCINVRRGGVRTSIEFGLHYHWILIPWLVPRCSIGNAWSAAEETLLWVGGSFPS